MKVITKQYLQRFRTVNGGWTLPQLRSIGVSWPPQRGWQDRLFGQRISDGQAAAFETGGMIFRDAKPRNPNRRAKTPLELGLAVPALGPSKWADKSEVEAFPEVDLFGDEPEQLREQLWPVIEGLG